MTATGRSLVSEEAIYSVSYNTTTSYKKSKLVPMRSGNACLEKNCVVGIDFERSLKMNNFFHSCNHQASVSLQGINAPVQVRTEVPGGCKRQVAWDTHTIPQVAKAIQNTE